MRLIANRSARNLLIGGTLGAAIALAIGYGPAIAQNGGAAGKPSVVATVRLSAVLEKLDQRGEAEANLNALAQKVKGDEKTRKDEIQKMQDQLEELRKAAGDAVDPGAEITDLQEQVASVVPEARSTTSWGTPGLDLGAGVRAQLAAAGIDDVRTVDACTREDASWPSYRRDGDAATRFAGVIWSHP